MNFSSLRLKITALLFSALVAACGGNGSPAAPPTGGITVVPGNTQVTVSWLPEPGVEYWLWYAPGPTVTISTPGHVSRAKVTSPFVLTGLVNGTTYSFAVNGRIDGGAGGALSTSKTTVPRPAGATWTAGGAMGAVDLRGIALGTASDATVNFVAMGNAGTIFKGTDGMNWTSVATGPTVDFKATVYTLGQFMAVGAPSATGNIFLSKDIATWAPATTNPGSTQTLNALASNNTLVVAVGDNGTIQTSIDGLTWVATTSPTTSHLYGVTYTASGLWLASGAAGTLLSSPDGKVWTARTSNTVKDLRAVAATTPTAGGTLYIAAGLGGALSTSPDGITWVNQTLAGAPDLYAINAAAIQSLVVGESGAAFTSTDGVTWTALTTGTASNLYALIGSPTQYIAIGAAGTNISSK